MKTLVFLLEEPSAREMLKALLPRILKTERVDPRFVVFQGFQGKQDLEKNVFRRISGWRSPETSFLIVRDQDSEDCRELKKRLLEACPVASMPNVIVRVACRKLESFYLGDLKAIEEGLGIRGLSRRQESRKFRSPDALVRPSAELDRMTKGKYQKISGSRAISPHLSLSGNRSVSFNALIQGIRKLVGEENP